MSLANMSFPFHFGFRFLSFHSFNRSIFQTLHLYPPSNLQERIKQYVSRTNNTSRLLISVKKLSWQKIAEACLYSGSSTFIYMWLPLSFGEFFFSSYLDADFSNYLFDWANTKVTRLYLSYTMARSFIVTLVCNLNCKRFITTRSNEYSESVALGWVIAKL